jgi:hypothetical protein
VTTTAVDAVDQVFLAALSGEKQHVDRRQLRVEAELALLEPQTRPLRVPERRHLRRRSPIPYLPW